MDKFLLIVEIEETVSAIDEGLATWKKQAEQEGVPLMVLKNRTGVLVAQDLLIARVNCLHALSMLNAS